MYHDSAQMTLCICPCELKRLLKVQQEMIPIHDHVCHDQRVSLTSGGTCA